MTPPLTPIAITAIGMSSSLGDVRTACAAARCGMSRLAPLPGKVALDDDGVTEVEVVGCAVPSAAGFIQNAAWVAMAVEAVRDAVTYGGLPPTTDRFWADTPMVWVVPVMEFDRFGWPEPGTPELLRRSCSVLLRSLLNLPPSSVPDVFVPSGNTGLAAAIEAASGLLQARLERVLVLATDSWLDPRSLNVLERQLRLKTAERAVGLLPGEGAACVLLEDLTSARRRKAPIAAVVAGASRQPPAAVYDTDDPHRWRTDHVVPMARALVATITSAAGPGFRGDAIIDLNGEDWRARIWGTALALLARKAELRAVVPAVSFGDTGAASAAFGVCIAARAFARGYAASPSALICSVAEDGQVATVRVSAP